MSNLVLRGSCILALIIFALPASSQIQNGEITGRCCTHSLRL